MKKLENNMINGYGMLGYDSTEGQWIRFYKENNPNATLREVAEIFRKRTNPEADIEVAERIVKVYLGIEPQESIDDLVPPQFRSETVKIDDFNAEQARQLADQGNITYEQMLNEVLKNAKASAGMKSRFAAASFAKNPHNDALVDDVIAELEKRGFAARCILVSGQPQFHIEVRF